MENLTRTEEKIYEVILQFIRENSYPPTIDQIAKHLDMWPQSVCRSRKKLFLKNWLVKVNRNVYVPHKISK